MGGTRGCPPRSQGCRAALGRSPLELLGAAAVKGAALSAEGDAVVDNFVAEARRACVFVDRDRRVARVTEHGVRERFVDRIDVAGRERFLPRFLCASPRRGSSLCDMAALKSGRRICCWRWHRTRVSLVSSSIGSVRSPTGSPASWERSSATARRRPACPPSHRSSSDAGSASLFALERGHDYVGTGHPQFVRARHRSRCACAECSSPSVSMSYTSKRELASCLCAETEQTPAWT
jgi:hypothetical protein